MNMDECKVAQVSEEILKSAVDFERDLRRLRRLLARCPACQGCYCPALLEISAAITAALNNLPAAWGLSDDEL